MMAGDTLPPGRASDTQPLPVAALRMIRKASLEGIPIVPCPVCLGMNPEFCSGPCDGIGWTPENPGPEAA